MNVDAFPLAWNSHTLVKLCDVRFTAQGRQHIVSTVIKDDTLNFCSVAYTCTFVDGFLFGVWRYVQCRWRVKPTTMLP